MTMGDPSGIGPEITRKAWSQLAAGNNRPFVLIGDPAIYRDAPFYGDSEVPVESVQSLLEGARVFPCALPVLAVECAEPPQPGIPHEANAAVQIKSIERAVRHVLAGEAAAVVMTIR